MTHQNFNKRLNLSTYELLFAIFSYMKSEALHAMEIHQWIQFELNNLLLHLNIDDMFS